MAALGNMCIRKSGLIVKLSRMSLSHTSSNPHLSLTCFQRLFHSRNAAAACSVWRLNHSDNTSVSRNVKWTFVSSNVILPKHASFYSTQTTEASGAEKDAGNEKEAKKSFFSQFRGVGNAWKLPLIILTAFGFFSGFSIVQIWGPPVIDEDGNEVIDAFTSMPKWKGYLFRTINGLNLMKEMIEEPSQRKLLPDPLQFPYHQPKYTLVLELTGLLVHPDWTVGGGWRFKKRPAVDQFLQTLVQGAGRQIGERPPEFEIVVYTKESGFTAGAVIEGLDKNGFIMYKLFRDATRYVDSAHVKDLDCLNRDLSKIIMVDWDPKAVKLHPRNAMLLPKWEGADDDRSLLDLASFLLTIAASDVDDVRTVLDHYSNYDKPLEAFKENQRKLQEEQMKLSQQKEQKSLVGSWASTLTGRRR